MNSLNGKKRGLRSLLPESIISTIDSLKEFVLEESEKFNSLILIESHFREIRKREQQGVISHENLQLEVNGLRKKLLDLIDDIRQEDTSMFNTKEAYKSQFIDSRDGQIYKTIELLGKIWMSENLNYDVGEGCWHYENASQNGEKYGRLYTWHAAFEACPHDWRLPTKTDWIELAVHFGGYYDWGLSKDIGAPKEAYNALVNGGHSGFNALLGGRRLDGDPDSEYLQLSMYGSYWSRTYINDYYATSFDFHSSSKKLYCDKVYTGRAISIRCIRAN